MSETIAEYKTRLDQRIGLNEVELRKAEIDHAFNWWWYEHGSRPPASSDDLEEHTLKISQEAFHEACRQFDLVPNVALPAPRKEREINQLYSLFALGVVVGVFLTFVLGLIILQPK